MLELRKASDRGVSRLDWLDSKHTFSFSHYYDPKQVGFSDLLVINDDKIKSGKGFGTHPHKDMEIFSYVLEGALEHKDSMGNGSIIYPGDVQMMSAGTGILHSEFNPSSKEDVHLLQIWITPERKSVTPRYQQVHFSDKQKQGKLCLIISPDGKNDSLSVYQDINVYAGLFDATETYDMVIPEDRYVYVHLARGSLDVNDQHLEAGDGMRMRHEEKLHFCNGIGAEVLVFEMVPKEYPEF
ncbi:pirin family protein [Neisseria sp. Ec49-e6-T10]|uniref:pirin family protein n=1 Tax=Neisseria sp. Ec49-e6-T10 TaxID=3140744 RepID=UPI003EC06A8A